MEKGNTTPCSYTLVRSCFHSDAVVLSVVVVFDGGGGGGGGGGVESGH